MNDLMEATDFMGQMPGYQIDQANYYYASSESSPSYQYQSPSMVSNLGQSSSLVDSFDANLQENFFCTDMNQSNMTYQIYANGTSGFQEGNQAFSSNQQVMDNNSMICNSLPSYQSSFGRQQESELSDLVKLMSDPLVSKLELQSAKMKPSLETNMQLSLPSLITPPLSPNNEAFLYSNKPPLFLNKPVTSSQSYLLSKVNLESRPVAPSNSNAMVKMDSEMKYSPSVKLSALSTSTVDQSVGFESGSVASLLKESFPSCGTVCQQTKSISIKSMGKGQSGSGKARGNKSKSKNASNKALKNVTSLIGTEPGVPKQSQKRSAHLSAEFRYRTKLNDKINRLRGLVSKQKHNLSKSAVLTRSIEMILRLQKVALQLHAANLQLQNQLQGKGQVQLKEMKTLTKSLPITPDSQPSSPCLIKEEDEDEDFSEPLEDSDEVLNQFFN